MPTPYAAYVAETINDLVNPLTSGRNEVTVLGYNTKGDGGGGTFYWSTGTYTADGGTIFPKGGTTPGAWIRVVEDDYNAFWFGVTGDGATDDTTALQNAINVAASKKKNLYLPTGTYLVKTSIGLSGYTHFIGDGVGKTIIKYDINFVGTNSNYVFEDDGASYIEFEQISFRGTNDMIIKAPATQGVRVNAFLGFNSYPNAARDLRVHHCEFSNAGVYRAINLGSGDVTQNSNDDVYIQYNYFHDLYLNVIYKNSGGTTTSTVLYQNVTDDSFPDQFTCKGINLQQTTKLVDISHNRFQDISSDGIFSDGQSAEVKTAGNCNIHHNIFFNTWMGVEINGGHLNYNQTIAHNYFYWMRRNTGFAISTDAYNCKILHNFIYLHDRFAIEYTSLGGTIDDNTIVISPYVAGANEGYPCDIKVGNIFAMVLYGFDNTISNNKIILQRYGTLHANTPDNYNCFQLLGLNTDPSTQPNSYQGYSNGTDLNAVADISMGWRFIDNYCENPQHAFILADVVPIRNVEISGNTLIGKYVVDTPIEINGFNWIIKNNIFDMTRATGASAGNVIDVYDTQTYHQGDTFSLVYDNQIINDAWGLGSTGKYRAFNNKFKTNGNVEYTLFPAPPVTNTQRSNLTGKEGMFVYQTDGTIGLYLYTSGAWKRVSLI